MKLASAALMLAMAGAAPRVAADDAAVPDIRARFHDQELVLDFARPMQAWGNSRSEELVSLQPAVPLRCEWASDTRLSCTPGDGERIAPATRYRVTLVAGLLTQSGERLPARVVDAETARPTLSAAIAQWEDGVPVIVVASDAAVDERGVAAALRLAVDGRARALPPLRRIESRGPWDTGSRFELRLSALDGHDRHLSLSVEPGLRSSDGPLPGIERKELLAAIANERFRLSGAVCPGRSRDVEAHPAAGRIAMDCIPGERLTLRLSAAPDQASREAFVQALPASVRLRSWEQESDWARDKDPGNGAALAPGYRAELTVDAVHAMTAFSAAALRAKRDGAPLDPVAIDIRTGDYRPVLRAPRRRAVVGDGGQPPVLVEAINVTSPFAVDVLALGRGAMRSEVLRVAASPHRNQADVLASATTAEVLADGGWARWQLPAPTANRHGAGEFIEFAAPGFDLMAVAGRREVLAWANAWDDGKPVAGARLELLWLGDTGAQPTMVARATTGADGVAKLELPPGFDTAGSAGSGINPLWLLRAEAGRSGNAGRAVLPVGTPRRYGLQLGLASPTKVWGVADRPLYRAGDTVRYRLWQRRSAAGRLLRIESPEPLLLKLHSVDESKVIKEWQATPTADGAIAGEVELPVHLTDATYCIGVGDSWDIEGTCFFVGTYRAQDLWVEAKTTDRVLRDGEDLVVDLEAGYYSGGAAAGVSVVNVTAMLTGLPLQSAYAQYRDFAFVEVSGEDARNGVALAAGDGPLRTDARGRLRIEQPVRVGVDEADGGPVLPAFGALQLVAEARLADREGTVSNAARARYARHDRYVGLRLHPRWLDAHTPVDVEAVVIDANGVALDDAQVEVEVHYLPGFEDPDAEGTALARCDIVTGIVASCDFPRARSGRYRITARSGDAAAAEIVRYVHVDGAALRDHVDATTLELIDAPAGAGDRVRVLLKQPSTRARVLFVHASGDAILGYQVEDMSGTVSDYALQVPESGARAASLSAYVRAAAPAPVEDGFRTPPAMSTASLWLELPPRSPEAGTPLALTFDAVSARPGEAARITLRNEGTAARDVVLAVVDDALRALGGEFLEHFDPEGRHWLGALRQRGYDRLQRASFGDWGHHGLRLALPWPAGSQEGPRGWASAPGAPGAAGDAVAAVPPPPGEPPVIFDDPSPMDAAAAPPASGYMSLGGDDSTSLDRIEVTGSRIKMTDIFHAGPSPEHGLRPRETMDNRPARPIARVRTRFADTALWQPDIRLAPGESRTIELVLPDNLTRWRAVAWTSDADDGFDMAEATLETGLPLEVRLQVPVRIYPGDRARLAANVRQAGDDVVVAQGALRVEGLDAELSHVQDVPLPARGQGSFALELAPVDVGGLLAIASAQSAGGHDAVAAAVDVASPLITARKVQAGWLQGEAIALDIPELPPGASDGHLHVSLLRGVDALITPWTRGLRDYPHRCWEQILSRAVAAALAIERGDAAAWPDAQAAVQEALDNAAVFQDEGGGFRFFAGMRDEESDQARASRVTLAVYTLRVFALLRELGHPVPERVDLLAREFLQQGTDIDEDTPRHGDLVAFVSSVEPSPDADDLDGLWQAWGMLSLPARIAATRALAAAGHPARGEAMQRLLDTAPLYGAVRVLRDARARRDDLLMSSDLREQCALIELLGAYPRLAGSEVRRSLVAGLRDLYAGGIDTVDTQAGAQCLIALRDLSAPGARAEISVELGLDDKHVQLVLPAGEEVVERELPLAAGARVLHMAPGVVPPAGASYVAELRYREDARLARPAALGLSIERLHEVLRDGAWMPVAGATVREGDWLRVTLVVHTSATRRYVAVTDVVPGGLRPTDLALSGIAGLDLAKVSDEGSHWFGTRRLDPRTPRFYAEFLPAGRHELHYFARAGNAGDYLAAPALAELMYGNTSHARTGATRLVIETAED